MTGPNPDVECRVDLRRHVPVAADGSHHVPHAKTTDDLIAAIDLPGNIRQEKLTKIIVLPQTEIPPLVMRRFVSEAVRLCDQSGRALADYLDVHVDTRHTSADAAARAHSAALKKQELHDQFLATVTDVRRSQNALQIILGDVPELEPVRLPVPYQQLA